MFTDCNVRPIDALLTWFSLDTHRVQVVLNEKERLEEMERGGKEEKELTKGSNSNDLNILWGTANDRRRSGLHNRQYASVRVRNVKNIFRTLRKYLSETHILYLHHAAGSSFNSCLLSSIIPYYLPARFACYFTYKGVNLMG